ncbi:MAG: sigma-54-dependent Fis family transcriptional regulator [Nitrospira sp.]|nr:sigma-54-dependent Fis family transcriptional regulator [Nitrospira sp.]MCA9476838.1 sigma-54-dependent Fis family transcriptional regulator [Nitrospira sp.]MCA9479585.1 sigma-54-dependent Fis family transcriptional regulator [Nitrospira sp.]MCB9711990.1 sigma-54-dependent Fis family transcriptional regulator [Nitrospiraceae bacterium]
MAETICVVDDEPAILNTLSSILQDEGYQVLEAKNGVEALKVVRSDSPDLVILDIWMPEMDGLEALKRLRAQSPNLLVVMMSGHGSIETAVKATKLGAYDYLEKPLDLEKVTILVRNALHQRKLEEENINLRIQVERRFELVGSSLAMERLREMIDMAAPANSRVLIAGANGTGKELVARAIHLKSPRHNRPFVEINCAAIPETLIESELFGHEKGAFSGATAMKRGKFELADGGTLFLDEIGDMSLSTQAKVLRALQEQQFTRVGGTKLLNVQVRVIAASNKDLAEEIEKGNFREDLYYRLNVLPITVPTLKERREDIPELANHFIKSHSEEQGMKTKALSRSALEVLQRHDWPGNIRELRNLMERLLIMVPSPVIEGPDVEMFLQGRSTSSVPGIAVGTHYASLREARNAFEREVISQKLRDNNWNVSKTADDLKIERSHLHRKIKLLNVELRPDH